MSSAVQEQMQQHSLASYISSPLINPGGRKVMNSELWHACAGPLVNLPQPGTLVYYFPQGHSEQVAASTRKSANSHIPNYPNLPSQLLCQVYNVTLHADKDTDEIYAQMTLQPVNSEYDTFPVPNSEHTKSKQPNEFFCKNLSASDTSTHGGFSVPRRAAEKLFPQLDYAMQPPNQELIVRDLHDNMWTFRHIYRGQPKRHLLTTGWSLFVGTKRLKAGDSVLFIRDEKSQLLLGIRRANRQQTPTPSSVLSADSMHIGVLAAAAHAASSRSPFTVYYNPRSCSSEFIIPLAKYQKAVYSQVSVGMRFGMMFETEESTKRRYMGTIMGISDVDPIRWPNSKWRNLQVGWDEHGYGERPDRVSLWDIDTPESLFVFPSPTLKRQCLPGFIMSGADIGFTSINPPSRFQQNCVGNVLPLTSNFGSEQLLRMLLASQIPPIPEQNITGSGYSRAFTSIPLLQDVSDIKKDQVVAQNIHNEDTKTENLENRQDIVENSETVDSLLQNQENVELKQDNNCLGNVSSFVPEYPDNEEWMSNTLCSGIEDPFLLSASDYVTVSPFGTLQFSCSSDQLLSTPELNSIQEVQESGFQAKNLSDTNGNMFTSPCVSSTVLEGFGINSDDLFSSFTSSQDIPDTSIGTSSGFNECNVVDRRSMKQAGKQHLRTYTKVQKIGSVGRSIDVTRFKNYYQLISAIACMFGLEGQLDGSRGSEWKLVYVDYENDVLLVGDDPWEEFVQCVRCIRILSPSEVQQMSEGGVYLTKQSSAPSV